MEKDLIDKLNNYEVRNDKFLRIFIEEFAKRQAQENFSELLRTAEKCGLTRISLNETEIIDPDKHFQKNDKGLHGWPVIWKVAHICNFSIGGNNNQIQIQRGYFLPEYFGTWDIKKKKKIGTAESLFGTKLGINDGMILETMNGESDRS